MTRISIHRYIVCIQHGQAVGAAFDVERELVSKQSAREHYGVALKADGTVDEAETARLRTKVAAE